MYSKNFLSFLACFYGFYGLTKLYTEHSFFSSHQGTCCQYGWITLLNNISCIKKSVNSCMHMLVHCYLINLILMIPQFLPGNRDVKVLHGVGNVSVTNLRHCGNWCIFVILILSPSFKKFLLVIWAVGFTVWTMSQCGVIYLALWLFHHIQTFNSEWLWLTSICINRALSLPLPQSVCMCLCVCACTPTHICIHTFVLSTLWVSVWLQ